LAIARFSGNKSRLNIMHSQDTISIVQPRRPTRTVTIGDVPVGSGHPVVIQSMCNTDTRDPKATLGQIETLARAGCEVARLAVPDEEAAKALPEIVAESPLPLVADIHFSSRLALMALDAGMHALRINPGNIGGERHVDAVVRAAKAARVPIRIGVNSGSVEKKLLKKFGGPTPEAMVESAMGHVRLLEERGFRDIKISLKSSSVPATVAAYRLCAGRCDYPLHVGVTEAGTPLRGAVKSSVGIGLLLAEGIGDTIRVSLTGDPALEIGVAWEMLRSLGLRQRGPEIVSCPTCGRTEIDLIGLAEEVERYLRPVTESFTVAVMGCPVNGPGEAREADIGVAGGKDFGVIFKKGEIVRRVDGKDLTRAFLQELEQFVSTRKGS